MKGIKVGTLYKLEGSIATDSGTVCFSVTIDNTTMLWHMRLGYMSEKSMDALSKRGLLSGQKIKKLDFCEYCVLGKQKRVNFKIAVYRIKGT